MHKKFEINQTKIKGSCQSSRKVSTHNSKSDLPLVDYLIPWIVYSTELATFGAEAFSFHERGSLANGSPRCLCSGLYLDEFPPNCWNSYTRF